MAAVNVTRHRTICDFRAFHPREPSELFVWVDNTIRQEHDFPLVADLELPQHAVNQAFVAQYLQAGRYLHRCIVGGAWAHPRVTPGHSFTLSAA